MQPTGSGIIEWRQAKGKGAKGRGKQFIELWTEFAGSRRDKAWKGMERHGRSQVCVGKKRIRIRTKVCYDFSHRPGSPHRRALSPSSSLAAVAHFLFRTRQNRRKTFCSARAKRQLQNIRKTFATCVGNKQQQRGACGTGCKRQRAGGNEAQPAPLWRGRAWQILRFTAKFEHKVKFNVRPQHSLVRAPFVPVPVQRAVAICKVYGKCR